MLVVIIVSFIVMTLTFLDSRKVLEGGMTWGFVLLAILAAIHYNFGSDYMDYLRMYESHTTAGVNLKLILSGDVYKDEGWALLEFIFKDIGGFFSMIVFLSVVQNVIYYRFIKDYVVRSWWPLSVFIYLFVTNYYLINMSMLRQGFTISLGILAYMVSVKGQNSRKFKRIALIVLSLLLAWFACYIHKTAYVIFLIVAFSFIPFKRSFLFAIVVLLFFVVMMLNRELLDNLFNFVAGIEDVEDFVKTYEQEESAGSIGLGFFLNIVPNIICMFYLIFCRGREYDARRKQAAGIFSLYLVTLPLAFLNQLSGRIGWYFTAFSILAIPYAYSWIKNNYLRFGITMLFVVMTMFDYFNFFRDFAYADAYRTFHTVFEVIF